MRSVILLVAALLALVAFSGHAQPPRPRGEVAREGPPLSRNDAEKKILSVIEEVGKDQRAGNMLVPVEDGRLLRILAESIGAKHIVELGTSVGYSGLWFSLALQKTGGKLSTFDIDKNRLVKARANFKRAGVESLITVIEGDAHEEVQKLKGPIDLVFLDADKEGYLDYLNKLLPLVRPGGLIVAHNMARPAPDPRYVRAVTTNPNLDTVFVNMHAAGVGITVKKR
ncbi:MAG: O-methyltransferase [Gemmataceae bacterium]